MRASSKRAACGVSSKNIAVSMCSALKRLGANTLAMLDEFILFSSEYSTTTRRNWKAHA